MTDNAKPLPGDLTRAARNKNMPLVADLVRRGADVNEVSHSMTPLIWAAANSDAMILNHLLMHHARVDDKNLLAGDTALHRAASAGHVHIVETLLKHKADINARNREGDTPLMAAAGNGKIEVVRFLISKGADLLARNNGHEDALSLARQSGRNETVTLLLEEAVKFRERKNSEAAHLKAQSKQAELKSHAPRFAPKSGPKP